MVTAKINGKEYNIPTQWNDVTVKIQLDVLKITRTDNFRELLMVSAYTGIELDLLKKMSRADFEAIRSQLEFVFIDIEDSPIENFVHNGHEYSLLPSMERAQTQDFITLESLMSNYQGKEHEALPYVVAVVAKREKETLFDYDVMERGKEFYSLPYPIAHNIYLFFCAYEKAFSPDLRAYLSLQHKKMQESLNYSESILRVSVGMGLWKKFLKVILLLYVRFIRKMWKSFFSSVLSESNGATSKLQFKSTTSKRTETSGNS